MSIVVIILGIILMIIGVRKENKTLRNIGIIIAVLGCILTAVSSDFLSGVQNGINDTVK